MKEAGDKLKRKRSNEKNRSRISLGSLQEGSRGLKKLIAKSLIQLVAEIEFLFVRVSDFHVYICLFTHFCIITFCNALVKKIFSILIFIPSVLFLNRLDSVVKNSAVF